MKLQCGAEVADVRTVEVAGYDDELPDADAAALGRRDDLMGYLEDSSALSGCIAAELGDVNASSEHRGESTRQLGDFQLGDLEVNRQRVLGKVFTWLRGSEPAWSSEPPPLFSASRSSLVAERAW